MWNVTCYDWKPTSADKVVAHAQRQIRGGDVILMHDGDQLPWAPTAAIPSKPRSVSSRSTRPRDYQFVTIPEMMKKQLAISN